MSDEATVMPDSGSAENLTDLLRGGYALQKAENDTLAQMVVQRPRNLTKVLADAITELELDPEFAEKAYYRIPYKDGDRTNWVQGLSIDAAMCLFRNFGNAMCGARPLEETEDGFEYEGTMIDLEKGIRVSRPGIASKYYKKRGTGQMVKWGLDRHPQLRNVAASKGVRNAILKVIPTPIQMRYWKRALELAAENESNKARSGASKKAGGGQPTEKEVAKAKADQIVERFAPMEVERKHLQAWLGKERDKKSAKLETITNEELGNLRGVYNAIKQGQSDTFQTFGVGGPGEVKGDEVKAAAGDPLGEGTTTEE